MRIFEGIVLTGLTLFTDFIKNNGNFAWTPSIGIEPGDDYALMIVSDEDDHIVDYSPRFLIEHYIVARQEIDSSYASSFLVPATTTPDANSPTPTTFYTSMGAATTPPSFTQTGSTQSESPQPSAQSSTSGGLSTAAAVGIGVGATLGALLVIGIVIFFFIRSRRQKHQGTETPHQAVAELGGTTRHPAELGQDWGSGEKAGIVAPMNPGVAELGGGLSLEEYQELERRRRAAELQGRPALPVEVQANPRAELEARRVDAMVFHEMGSG